MRIGELARLTGTSAETIRYYEKEGLLPPPARTGANYRSYGVEHRQRLTFIRRARDLGFRLDAVRELLGRLSSNGVPVAAICGATLEVVRAGLTRGVRHTSNALGYLKAVLPGYADEEFYVDRPAVADGNLITAGGLDRIEFAYEIVKRLEIFDEAEAGELYEMFKNGVVPARYMA